MKVLLIGTYERSRQESMHRFAEMLRQGLMDAGHDVRLVRPPAWLGRLGCIGSALGKWLGYIDRFVLYPALLRRQVRWAEVVHVCVDPIYIPHLHTVPHVFTCHDVLPIRAALGEFPQCRVRLTGRVYQRWSLHRLRKAGVIVCVSEQTKREAQRVTRLPESQLVVVPNALNYPYRPMASDEACSLLRTLGLEGSRPFFFHIGGNQWYKNRLGVLQLFAELIKQPGYEAHRLVMAGKPWTEEMRRIVTTLRLQDNVIELANVSSEQLRALYCGAEALLFPSLHEGFGWPIVEAQACGCPVVTSSRPPMTDVGGEAAIYIELTDMTKATSIIVSALKKRERWRKAGLQNAARFQMKAMIEGYVRCYRMAVGLDLLSAENFLKRPARLSGRQTDSTKEQYGRRARADGYACESIQHVGETRRRCQEPKSKR